MKIDWSDPECQITEHFKVKEATTMGGEFVIVRDEKIQENIIRTAKKMETLRKYFDRPIIVHSWVRDYQYNKKIGGAKGSMHLQGLACDFHVGKRKCDRIRMEMLELLKPLGIRMENNPGSNWVHIDLKQFNRFFKP